MRFRSVFLAPLLLCLLPPPPLAASCGSATCFLVSGTQDSLPGEGKFRLDLSYRGFEQERKRRGSHTVDEVLVPEIDFAEGTIVPDGHRELRTQTMSVQLDLQYGFSERFAVVATLPLVMSRDHEHFHRHIDPDAGHEEEVDHETGSVPGRAHVPAHGLVEEFSKESYRGFGDVQLGARYGLVVRPVDLLLGQFSLELPTGESELSGHEGAIGEPGLQPGSGSTDFIFSLYYAHQLAPRPLELFAAGSLRANTGNDLDYRLGNEGVLNLGGSYRASDRWTWSLQLNWRHTGRDEFSDTEVPSTGATYVNLTPGVRFNTAAGLGLYGHIQVPVYQYVNEEQLAPGPALVLGASRSF